MISLRQKSKAKIVFEEKVLFQCAYVLDIHHVFSSVNQFCIDLQSVDSIYLEEISA